MFILLSVPPEPEPIHYLLPAGGGLIALLVLYFAFRSARKRRLVANIPTSKTTGVFIGLVEVKGTAEAENPLVSRLRQQRCVYYQWSVEEKWSRTTTETYTENGQTKTRTKHESGWKTVASGGDEIPFYLKDDEGAVLVRPDGANIHTRTIMNENFHRGDPFYYEAGPRSAIMDSDHVRRFTEEVIPLHHPIYVMGQAREREDIVAPEIAYDKHASMFLISTKSEDKIISGMMWSSLGLSIFGLLLMVGTTVAGVMMYEDYAASSSGFYSDSNNPPITAGVIGAAVYAFIWGASWFWMAYNSTIDHSNRVKQAWANVEVQLKRRHDLIPRLVKVVSGMKDYEDKVQTQLASLRHQAAQQNSPTADLHGCRQEVNVIAEAYPDLKSNELFLELQAQLANTEERIALARSYYNDIASYFNTRLLTFPDGFIVKLAGKKEQALITATDFEKAPVRVNFSD